MIVKKGDRDLSLQGRAQVLLFFPGPGTSDPPLTPSTPPRQSVTLRPAPTRFAAAGISAAFSHSRGICPRSASCPQTCPRLPSNGRGTLGQSDDLYFRSSKR